MDFIAELAEMALASRLRRLSDRMVEEVGSVYVSQNIGFDPRWFPYFHLLKHHAPVSVADIARLLNVFHPTVIKVTNEMLAAGLIVSQADMTDKRKRALSLSVEGHQLAQTMQPLWENIQQAMQSIMSESGYDVLDVLAQLEKALDKQGIRGRVLTFQEKQDLRS